MHSQPNKSSQKLPKLSIGEAEKVIKELRSINPRTKTIRAKISQHKSLLNQIYTANKKRVSDFEKTNYEYIALIRSTNDYYKLFGHSALYYTFSLAPKLSIPVHIQEDKDYTARSSEGFVSIRDLDGFTKSLQSLNIKRIKTKDRSGDFILYKLPWHYTEEQLASFIENNHTNIQKFNHVVIVDNIIPVLFVQTEELLKAIYENVRGMASPVERETFGYATINNAITIAHLYFDLANGHLNKLSCLKQMKTPLKLVKYQVKLITDLKIWTPKTCARIGEIIIKLQDIIEHEIKNI